MSSGMNLEEAKEYAETMSYRKAINNIRYAKGIAYKKATRIKLRELAEIADGFVRCVECRYKGMEICPMYKLTKAGVLKPYDFCSYGQRAEQTEPKTDWHYDEQDSTWYPYKHKDEPKTENSSEKPNNSKVSEIPTSPERSGE